MYESLKSWISIPIQIKPFIKRTGSGSKQFGEPVDTTCYLAGATEVVKDKDGEEVVSNTQVYLNGNQSVSIMDRILLDGAEYDIKTISSFYRDGRIDIKVVYL